MIMLLTAKATGGESSTQVSKEVDTEPALVNEEVDEEIDAKSEDLGSNKTETDESSPSKTSSGEIELTRTFLNHGRAANNHTFLPLSHEPQIADQVGHILADSVMNFGLEKGVMPPSKVRVTTKLPHIDMKSNQEWLGILSRWSCYSHTMITAWGEFTFTLEDVSVMWHLPMLHNSGENLENPFDKGTVEDTPDDTPGHHDEQKVHSILLG
ncbi:hypothetical protein COLO4_37674 [Corchorus olitorius]|uniref:Aminotransferase-like plant mobile domain-containing protein n=1 Tax=Corchorus olitorius TaxID=93759 RepID=A0A1R3G033_9ROSI|nr:hypothetical protein COLO4_37674 [Corchorus olitorius]